MTFQNVNFIGLAILLCRKDYEYLAADCLVPMGNQVELTKEETVAMLKRKTRRFSKDMIIQKFGGRNAS